MRSRNVLALALAGLLAASPAHARDRRALYGALLGSMAAISWSALSAGLVLRYDTAPNAATLETFKREGSASEAMLGIGGAVQVAALIFSLIGGLSGLADRDRVAAATPRPRTTWSLAASAGGLAVRF